MKNTSKNNNASVPALIKELKDDDALEGFLMGPGPMLLDLYASSCVPCQKVTPILEELAEEYKDKVIFGKIDIEESELARDLMKEFGIIGVPAVMVLGNGKGGTLVGYKGRRDYKHAIVQILEAEKPAQQMAKEGVGCPMHF